MSSDHRSSRELVAETLEEFLYSADQQLWPSESPHLEGPKSFRFAAGLEPIQLGNVEFRILLFLASKPYHAFTRRSISAAVSTLLTPVAEEEIDGFVSRLRDQLGVFHDYVQTVPYVGYRFKA